MIETALSAADDKSRQKRARETDRQEDVAKRKGSQGTVNRETRVGKAWLRVFLQNLTNHTAAAALPV